MKIVCLDGYTLNPGDQSWEGFRALGDFTCYDRTAPEEVLSRAKGAEALLINKTMLREETLEKLPDVKYIGVLATGYNVVPLDYVKARGIHVTHVPNYGTDTVAQHVFALLLYWSNHVSQYHVSVQRGDWIQCPDFTYMREPLMELSGKTMGIIGMGRIGKKVASIAEAFGMKVVTLKRSKDPGYPELPLDELLAQSDVVSLHCPLTQENRHLIGEQALKQMKKTSILINTSRGPLVDEKALVVALEEGVIAGAALDVIEEEPMGEGSPLLGVKNLLVTPHIAWASREARERLMAIAVDNLKSFMAGDSLNLIKELQ